MRQLPVDLVVLTLQVTLQLVLQLPSKCVTAILAFTSSPRVRWEKQKKLLPSDSSLHPSVKVKENTTQICCSEAVLQGHYGQVTSWDKDDFCLHL